MNEKPPRIPKIRYRDEDGEWEPVFHPLVELVLLLVLLALGMGVVCVMVSLTFRFIRWMWDLI